MAYTYGLTFAPDINITVPVLDSDYDDFQELCERNDREFVNDEARDKAFLNWHMTETRRRYASQGAEGVLIFPKG